MIAVELALKIAELFCYLFLGFLMVRTGALKEEDRLPLTKILLYLIQPLSILYAFQIDASPDVLKNFAACFVMVALYQVVFFIVAEIYTRLAKGTEVDKASVAYSNVGNLTIPLTISLLGEQWVVYVTPYLILFNLLAWTHGVRLFSGEKTINLKKILINPNVIACIAGLVMLFTGIRFRGIPLDVVSKGSAFVGPLAMFITGIVLAEIKPKKYLRHAQTYSTIFMRMVFASLLAVGLTRLALPFAPIPDAQSVFLVVLLGAIAPPANMLGQFAIIYRHDVEYTSALNVLSTLACIATMPLMIYLYYLGR